MFRTILGATISILFAHSAAVLGAPEFVVTPLLPPPTAIGQRPAIATDADEPDGCGRDPRRTNANADYKPI